MKKISKDERGIAHIVMIVLVVLVLAGIGFAAWRVMGSKKSTNSASNTPAAVVAANKEAEDACNKLYDDKDLCKFASYANLTTESYRATFTNTDKDGKVTSFESSQDGKGNSSTISKEGNKEVGAFIMLNGDSYIKDPADGSWTKYPKGPEAPKDDTKPTDDLKVDFKEEESKTTEKRVTYKKLGKEKCGNANCFKYQVIDPADPGSESIVWFGDKDYVLRKWSFKDKDGSTNVGEFTYTAVTISAPSPVKEAPAIPDQAEIQRQIEEAQNAL